MDPNLELIGLLNSRRAVVEDGKRVVITSTLPKEKAGPEGKDLLERVKYRHRVKSLEGPYHPFYRFKPIFVLCDKGTSDRNLEIIVEALEKVLSSVGMKDVLPVHIFGYWNQGNGPHQSIDWYIQRAFDSERKMYDIHNRGQCSLEQFWRDLNEDPIQRKRPHYDVVVLSDFDLSGEGRDLNYLIGEGEKDGTILSITRYKNRDKEIVKQAALHEFGHTFANIRGHCGNVGDGKEGECTMKFPNSVNDLELQARYRNRTGVLFCNEHTPKRYRLDDIALPASCIEGYKLHLEIFPELYTLCNKVYSLDKSLLIAIDYGKLALLETRLVLR